MTDKTEPCGNDDCDLCDPLPRWKVSTETVRRTVHEREIKAATMEEALAIYAQGTSWPSEYDEQTVETLSEDPPKVTGVLPRREKWRCWHSLGDEGRFNFDASEETDIYPEDSE